MDIPTPSRLIFGGVTPGEGMAMDALAEGFWENTCGPPNYGKVMEKDRS